MRKLNSHDLFTASRVIGALGYKKVIQGVYEEVKKIKPDDKNPEKAQEEAGLIIIASIFDAISSDPKVESAFYEFVSGPFEMDIKDIQNMPPLDLINKTKELINSEDKESWKAFMNSLASLMR